MSTESDLQLVGQEFLKVVEHLKSEYGRLQAGRASANLFEGVQVDSYGSMQPLKAVGNITIPDSKTIQIQPWDKGILAAIEKAIMNTGLNLNPTNDGSIIRIVLPALTEERRKDLVKIVHKIAEDSKISVRNIRQKYIAKFKESEKAGEISEDLMHGAEKKLQEAVDKVNKEIEEVAKAKEADIMTV